MARLELPSPAADNPHYIPPLPGEDVDHDDQHTEINDRVNGQSPLPALLVNADGTALPIARSPVSISALVDASEGADGTDFCPIILAPGLSGDFSDVVTASDGFQFLFNGFGTLSNVDGGGHIVGWLFETSPLTAITASDTTGVWAENQWYKSDPGGHIAGMRSLVVITPGHKGSDTSGTADEAYGIAIYGGDDRDLGAAQAYSLLLADSGNAYVSGSIVAGAGIAIPAISPLLLGNIELTDDGSGNLYLNGGGLVSPFIVLASDVYLEVGHGSPNGVLVRNTGSIFIDLDATGGIVFWGKSTNASAFGWGPLYGAS